MSEAKFTPGPWEYGTATNYNGFYIAPKGTLLTLAALERPVGGCTLTIECFNFPGETEANARLIAASPIMFAYIEKKAADGDDEAQRIIGEINA